MWSALTAPALERDLDRLASGHRQDESVTIVITFHEDQLLPRFPEPDVTQPRSAAFNQAALQQAQRWVRGIEQSRALGLNAIASELQSKHGAVEVARFWAIKAMTVRIPLSAIPDVLNRGDVQHVEYDQTDSPPPQALAGSISDGRSLVLSDFYRTAVGWFGLIDTGVRKTHTLFTSPKRIDFWRDCVNGTSHFCSVGSNLNPDDDLWNHGTATANACPETPTGATIGEALPMS